MLKHAWRAHSKLCNWDVEVTVAMLHSLRFRTRDEHHHNIRNNNLIANRNFSGLSTTEGTINSEPSRQNRIVNVAWSYLYCQFSRTASSSSSSIPPSHISSENNANIIHAYFYQAGWLAGWLASFDRSHWNRFALSATRVLCDPKDPSAVLRVCCRTTTTTITTTTTTRATLATMIVISISIPPAPR